MTEKNVLIAEAPLTALELRLNELLSVCDTLKQQNTNLHAENQVLVSERGQLLYNRDKIRGQVEAMITRLKAMESS